MKTLNVRKAMNRTILSFIFLCLCAAFSSAAIAQDPIIRVNEVVGVLVGETPANTVISSQAFGTFEDANGNVSSVQSNEVTTVVTAIYGVDISPESTTKAGEAGEVTPFSFQILNIGNDGDNFDFNLSSTPPDGWTTEFVKDLNEDGVWDPEDIEPAALTPEIPSNEAAYYHLLVTVPGTETDGAQGTFEITAVSQGDTSKTDTGTYVLNVQAGVVVLVKAIVDTPTTKPGDIVTYSIYGENTGTITVTDSTTVDVIPIGTTYVLGSMRRAPIGTPYEDGTPLGDGTNDSDTADFNIRNPGAITVGPVDLPPAAAAELIYFKVQIDANVVANTTISNVATESFLSGGTPISVESNSVIFTVEASGDSILTPSTQAGTAEPSQTVVYPLLVANEGNSVDTINLSVDSTSGLVWTFYNGANPLVDTDDDQNPDTGPLAAGATLAITIQAVIPVDAIDSSVDTTTITAITSITLLSAEDPTNVAIITTTIEVANLSLVKSVSPTGEQPPGTELTYTLLISNSGSGTAREVVITDQIPQWTKYVVNSMRGRVAGGEFSAITDDANDTDGAFFDSGLNQVKTDPLTIGPGLSGEFEFKVTID